jgi:NAD(P)H-dependent FMN reductase
MKKYFDLKAFYKLIISISLCLATTLSATPNDALEYAIIIGSQRAQSQSQKVGKFIEKTLKDQGKMVSVIDLYIEKLPLWEEQTAHYLPLGQKIWQEKISPKLAKAAAFIIITPEYNGATSPSIKNFFLYPKQGELAHKPALLVGVSAGVGGGYPLAELRATSHKDTFMVYMPGNVIVREVNEQLNENEAVSKRDQELKSRIHYSLKVLEQYGLALAEVRKSKVVDLEKYPFGQ